MNKKKSNDSVLKQQIDNTPLGTIIITAPDSSVLYVNKKIQEKTGFTPGEVIGKKPGALWGGKMNKQFYARLWQTIATQKQPFIGSVINTKKNGTNYIEHLHIAPILDIAGNIKFFIEINPEESATLSTGSDFIRIFTEQFKKQHIDDRTLINFFLQTVAPSAVKLTKRSSFTLLEQFLQEILLDPTTKQYRNRSDDARLIQAAQKQGADFDNLYEKYAQKIQQYFLKRADPSIAEDLTQETFLQAFRYLPRFTITNASYLTYLLRIAHTTLVGHYRTTGRTPTTYNEALIENHPATAIDQEKFWDLEKLWEAVATLPKTEQKILLLKYHQDARIKDIAKEIGKSENAVKIILSRARKKLRQGLVSHS